ncbi:MAG TPA: TonB family protein [Pyrinomonadaceae bacterium]|nr:TonB family protein [Pyrinomonadaceae bacterium]
MKTTSQLVLTFLLNASWQVILIAGAATLCDWLLRRAPARYRHALWVIALCLSVLVPALSLSPRLRSSASESAQLAVPKIETTPLVTTTIRSIDGEVIGPAESKTPTAAPVPNPPPRNVFSAVQVNQKVAAILVGAYLLFALYAGLRFFLAWRRTRHLVKTAFPFELPQTLRTAIQTCERAINVRGARILCSETLSVPITVGTRRPLIILPSSFLHESDEEVLTSAIGHELVHVARRDYLANFICEFVFLPLSFHPAAMLMRRRIRQTRELCCDEWVASKLLRPEVYARSLVRLIGSVPVTRRLAADTTIGIAESHNLEDRIMSLLRNRQLSNRRKIFRLVAAMMLLSVPSAAATSFALSFEINGQDPGASFQNQQKSKQDADNLRATLERRIQELRDRGQQAPVAERRAIEARIRELQRALEEHETLVQQYEKKNQGVTKEVEARLAEVRSNLEQHAKMLEQYQQNPELQRAKESQERLKQLLEKYPESAMAKEKLAEADRLYLEMLAKESAQQANRHAKVIYRVEPAYPDDARDKQIKGSVLLTMVVDAQGNPTNIQITKSLYPSMDQAAIEAARKMRFEPALKDGQPVSDSLLVEFYFSLYSKHVEVMAGGVGTGSGQSEGSGKAVAFDMRRRKDDQQGQEDRARRQAELVQGANISMDRAIQIATSKFPGKVLACSLGRDKDGPVFYHLVIINTEGEKRTTKYVWISAIDGTIIKTEDEVKGAAAISGGVLNGKAISLPNPAYPPIARAAKASGTVTVEIIVDERGNVISANPISGHPLLQGAATDAARQAKFTPTQLQGNPVKVSGQVVYNFELK